MKVLELKTRQIIEVNESFGARLIEQGRAILTPPGARVVPVNPPPAEPENESNHAEKPEYKPKQPRKKGDA